MPKSRRRAIPLALAGGMDQRMPTLEGARLLLRPLTLADAHHFAGLFGGDWVR